MWSVETDAVVSPSRAAGRRGGGAEAAGLPGAEQREEAAGIAPGSEKTPLSRALTGACRNVADPADETPPQLP